MIPVANHPARRASNAVMNKVIKGMGAGIRVLTAVVNTRSLAYLRLYLMAARLPYYTPGSFQFPFGTMHYVDIGSLPFLYYEIFVDRVYDVSGLGTSPNIIDCGGNIGMATARFKLQYPQARVTVYEADPSIAQVLEGNVKTLELDRVTVVQAAVSAKPGTGAFLEDGAIGGRLIDDVGMKAVRVATVRLSDHIDSTVEVLKLDVEGAEFGVIEDLCRTGKIQFVRNIICEIHGTGAVPDPTADLWQSLSGAGFRISVNWAAAIDAKEDTTERPPFAALPTAHFRMLLYAWRQ